jgi:hypothetical protein
LSCAEAWICLRVGFTVILPALRAEGEIQGRLIDSLKC